MRVNSDSSISAGAAPLTSGQRLNKIFETMEKCVNVEEKLQTAKQQKDHDLEKLRLQYEHEREMAKIKLDASKLEVECEKLALQRDRLRAEAAAFGPVGSAGDATVQPAESSDSFDPAMYQFDD